MAKTIYITDGDALNIDRVVVSTGDLKGCKVFYSCDLIDEYEARLQADMVAMLEEIQLELDEMKITKVRSAGFAPYSKDPFRRGVNCSKELIQQKINSLEEART